jgi:penicillin-binding protein 2
VTVTGTVAIECILSDKPLGLLGPSVVQDFNGCYTLKNPKEVSNIITSIENHDFTAANLNDKRNLIKKLVSSSYKGLITDPVSNPNCLQEENLFPTTYYSCNHGYYAGGVSVGCHSHKSPLNLYESIQMSCNAYYCNVFRHELEDKRFKDIYESYGLWRKYITSLGFGSKLGIDLPNESGGFIPKASYYDRFYGKGGWKALTIISLAIGQGEILVTPLQLANFAALISNRGFYIKPHVVKEVEGKDLPVKYKVYHYTAIDKKYFDEVINGMYLAVNGGPGATARIASVNGLDICGKTGTAQNPHGTDHSVFMAFAPKDNPQIAVAVVVENGGYGASIAAPIASILIEKYLNGQISKSRQYLINYIKRYKPRKK